MSKKKKKINNITLDTPIKPNYKCFNYFNYDNFDNKIFFELGKTSKTVYNLTIYCINIFNYFKYKLYSELYNHISNDNNFNYSDFIKNKLIFYFDLYSSINKFIKQNNDYIYKYIKDYILLHNIIIENNNYEFYKNYFIEILHNNNNIHFDLINNNLLFEDIIINIINSIYMKNYNTIKNQMLEHKQFTIKSETIINDIKNGNIMDLYPKNTFKSKIISEFNIELKSDQNYIERLVYTKLGDNTSKIDTTMIGSIMSKANQAYSSYYALLEKKIKANKPKYLKKDSVYNLLYTFSKTIKIDETHYKIYTSKYISKNFNNVFGDNYSCIANNKYIDKKYLLKISNKKITKKNNYVIDKYYIPKDNQHIIDSRYIIIDIPEKAKDLNIKMIDIKFINNYTKICLIYDTKIINKKEKVEIIPEESISIDLGMKNLLAIYDPSGYQKIIDGKFISSINTYYTDILASVQSKKNKRLFNKYQSRRKNIINNYFNLIVKWLVNKYESKKLIIIGYNKGWKNNSNLGTETNKKFNKIPYMTLINKIKNKCTDLNKNVIIIEESYTSKCDGLSLEEICYHEKYMGNRNKRGLFSSATKKLINADINGAINIMRKVYTDIKEIKGNNICNVSRVKIFREVL